jgi:hypothetical protein
LKDDNEKLKVDQTITILQTKFENLEIKKNLEEFNDQASTMNIVISNWPTYFSSTCC